MSRSQAIAAVTATLRHLLERGFDPTKDTDNADAVIAGTPVTTRPPDEARQAAATGNQLNLYLYQVMPNGSYRNMDIPGHVRTGETAQPPLALNLYYLLTAYAIDDQEPLSQRILGRAMSVLHDHSLLGREEIKAAISDSGVNEQFERIRLSLQPLALEDIFKLWSGFQTHYRLSAAYEATVVLIDSTQSPKTPLPVLTRGKEDRGVESLLGGAPTLEEIRVPLKGSFEPSEDVRLARVVPSAQLGDEIALLGSDLDSSSVRVVFQHTSLTDPTDPPNPLGLTKPIKFAPEKITRTSATEIVVKLPAPGNPLDPASPTAKFPVGVYTAQVFTSQPEEPERPSNLIPFSLAPAISLAPNPANAGDIALNVTCAPMVRPGQQVWLLFRDTTSAPDPHNALTDKLTFQLKGVPVSGANDYVVRLRVDGMDSMPIDRSATTPKFADNQKLKVM
jgi:hypothetical protein